MNETDKKIVDDWLKDNDLIIASEPINIDMEEGTWDTEYTVTNIPDPSVGIFPYRYSPSFNMLEEVYEWCRAIMELFDVWDDYIQNDSRAD